MAAAATATIARCPEPASTHRLAVEREPVAPARWRRVLEAGEHTNECVHVHPLLGTARPTASATVEPADEAALCVPRGRRRHTAGGRRPADESIHVDLAHAASASRTAWSCAGSGSSPLSRSNACGSGRAARDGKEPLLPCACRHRHPPLLAARKSRTGIPPWGSMPLHPSPGHFRAIKFERGVFAESGGVAGPCPRR